MRSEVMRMGVCIDSWEPQLSPLLRQNVTHEWHNQCIIVLNQHKMRLFYKHGVGMKALNTS